MNKVLKFIDGFKSFEPQYIQYTFYHGYCYWFAFILAERFKGEIWFNPDIVHFAAKINNILYDIYGVVTVGQNPITGKDESDKWISWEEFQYNHQESVKDVVNSCIKKI